MHYGGLTTSVALFRKKLVYFLFQLKAIPYAFRKNDRLTVFNRVYDTLGYQV